jgi:hypothetical protein
MRFWLGTGFGRQFNPSRRHRFGRGVSDIPLRQRGLCGAAERNMVVQIKQIKPCHYILPFRADFRMKLVEVLARLGISRSTLFGIRRPGCNLSIATFVFRIFLDPGKDFSITFSVRELLLQVVGLDANKIEETLVHRAGVTIFAIFSSYHGTSFVDHPCQDDESPEPHAWAAGRALS